MRCDVLKKRFLVREKRIRNLNNNGSALLTVILVVAFLTILATTLLYITGMNFQIKQADYQNKKNFYSGEIALEEIRAGLMEDVSKAAVEAYADVAMNYISLQTDAGDGAVRQLQYNNYFVTRLQEEWDADLAANGNSWDSLLTTYRTNGTLKWDMTRDTNADTHLSSTEVLVVSADAGKIVIKGVQMEYIDPATQLTTIISTDFEVSAPAIDWSACASLDTRPTGVDDTNVATTIAVKNVTTPSGTVIYTNWKKE